MTAVETAAFILAMSAAIARRCLFAADAVAVLATAIVIDGFIALWLLAHP